MSLLAALLGLSTCLGNSVLGAFLGSWLSIRFWDPLLKRPAHTPDTEGLTLKDLNQLRLKKLFLAVERVQFESIAITGGANLRIGVYDLPLRADEQIEGDDYDHQIFFKPSCNVLDTVNSMTKYTIGHSDQLWYGNEPHDACSNVTAYFASLNRKRGRGSSALAHLSGWKMRSVQL
jgi:hypothetical protein